MTNEKKCEKCANEVYHYAYNKGRMEERKYIISMIDEADDSMQAMGLLTKYLLSESLKEVEE